MAPLTPGSRVAVLSDRVFWAPLGSVLPASSLGYGATWPGAWTLIDDTANGMQVTVRQPRTPYRSEERGEIARLLGDDYGIALGFADQTPAWDFAMQLSNFSKVHQAAVTGPPAYPAMDVWHQDMTIETNIMMGFEGRAYAGTLFDVDTLVRGIAYSAQQTANVNHFFRNRGADSPFRITAAMECLPYPVKTTTAMLTATGIQAASLDPSEKFDYFIVNYGT